MKRGNATQEKLKSQKINFVRGLHYEYVEEVARRKVVEEKRRKRIDIIVKMNIRKDKGFKLPNGAEVFVRSIKSDGIIVLDSWDEIDVSLVFL